MGREKGNGHAKDSNDYESGEPPDGGALGEGVSFSCPVQNLVGKSHYNNPSLKEIHMENNCHYDQHFRKALV